MIRVHLVALVLINLAAAAAAQEPTVERTVQRDAADRGGWVARRTCASCHAVARTGTSPMETAPPFRDIVRRRSLSELENRFVDGAIADHPSMPDYVFRAREIDDLIAYLESLQAEERTP